VLGAGAGAVMGQYFCVRGHKAAQSLRVFVIHGADFIGAKIALLFYLGSFSVPVSAVVLWSHED